MRHRITLYLVAGALLFLLGGGFSRADTGPKSRLNFWEWETFGIFAHPHEVLPGSICRQSYTRSLAKQISGTEKIVLWHLEKIFWDIENFTPDMIPLMIKNDYRGKVNLCHDEILAYFEITKTHPFLAFGDWLKHSLTILEHLEMGSPEYLKDVPLEKLFNEVLELFSHVKLPYEMESEISYLKLSESELPAAIAERRKNYWAVQNQVRNFNVVIQEHIAEFAMKHDHRLASKMLDTVEKEWRAGRKNVAHEIAAALFDDMPYVVSTKGRFSNVGRKPGVPYEKWMKFIDERPLTRGGRAALHAKLEFTYLLSRVDILMRMFAPEGAGDLFWMTTVAQEAAGAVERIQKDNLANYLPSLQGVDLDALKKYFEEQFLLRTTDRAGKPYSKQSYGSLQNAPVEVAARYASFNRAPADAVFNRHEANSPMRRYHPFLLFERLMKPTE